MRISSSRPRQDPRERTPDVRGRLAEELRQWDVTAKHHRLKMEEALEHARQIREILGDGD